MTTMTVTSQVDPNGVLHLDLGPAAAGKSVRVIVDSTPPAMTQDEWRAWVQKIAGSVTDPTFRRHEDERVREPLSPEEWRKFVEDTAGTWQGNFERPPQGEFETRETL